MSEIKSSISEKLHRYYHYMNSVVVMPDFFVDRIIKLKSKEEFFCKAQTGKDFIGQLSGWQQESASVYINSLVCKESLSQETSLLHSSESSIAHCSSCQQ